MMMDDDDADGNDEDNNDNSHVLCLKQYQKSALSSRDTPSTKESNSNKQARHVHSARHQSERNANTVIAVQSINKRVLIDARLLLLACIDQHLP
jgi:hypothetical protein